MVPYALFSQCTYNDRTVGKVCILEVQRFLGSVQFCYEDIHRLACLDSRYDRKFNVVTGIFQENAPPHKTNTGALMVYVKRFSEGCVDEALTRTQNADFFPYEVRIACFSVCSPGHTFSSQLHSHWGARKFTCAFNVPTRL